MPNDGALAVARADYALFSDERTEDLSNETVRVASGRPEAPADGATASTGAWCTRRYQTQAMVRSDHPPSSGSTPTGGASR